MVCDILIENRCGDLERIQRGEAAVAAKILGVRSALLSALSHFFEHGRWGSVVQRGLKGQRLTPDDQLFVLMQAAAPRPNP